MKKNVGQLDRILRAVFAFLVALLVLTNVVTGTWAIILGILGAVLLLTSLVSVCPLYKLLGVSTLKKS